jgi:trimeric autotransporter adhesin
MNPLIKFKTTALLPLIALACVCFGLVPLAEAVLPPPDGGYPGFNTAEGQNALFSLTTGQGNTAVGWLSLFSDTENSFNTATGVGALVFNTADNNTATGAAALLSNTSGGNNTAVGATALLNNTEGQDNTAIGFQTLRFNTTGGSNTAIGIRALFANTSGTNNTAVGSQALLDNTSGIENTATGVSALFNNTTGNDNTAVGSSALHNNGSGGANTATGAAALAANTTGDINTAVGALALNNNTTGGQNVALGHRAGVNQTNGNGNVYIGAFVEGVAGESNACYIRSIFGQTSASGAQVVINSDNKLGTSTSSKRFKEDIRLMGKTSEAVFALKPVTFRYKKDLDPKSIPQFGLVAEDVEKVNPDLVVRDKKGKPYSVRYDQVNAMLLNEFLKEHRTVLEQKAIVEQLKQDFQSRLARQQKQIEALAAGLQKVSAQLELTTAPQVVATDP